MDINLKRYLPIAISGLALLLTSCSSNTSTSTTTTSTTSTSSASDDEKKADSDDNKSESSDKADASTDGDSKSAARNLYVEQLNKQDSKINTGVVYWLELNRDGKKTHVTNKTQFQEGDKVRIHVKPNIACWSYILLLQGSNGEHSVLFPSKDLPDNKLKAGSEVILPMDKTKGEEAWLSFDDHPGTELVRVVVSRKKIDPEKELPDGESNSVKIAAARGDDDDVPDGTAATIVGDSDAQGSRNLTVVTGSKHPDEEGQVTVVGKSGEKALRVDIAMNHKEAKEKSE
jgi:hypothetical protein